MLAPIKKHEKAKSYKLHTNSSILNKPLYNPLKNYGYDPNKPHNKFVYEDIKRSAT
jgi:hypothetical protein